MAGRRLRLRAVAAKSGGLGGAPGLRPEFCGLSYRFDEGYDAPRGWLACKLGAPSGGGLIA